MTEHGGPERSGEYVTVWMDHKPTKLHWGVPVVRCRNCEYYTPESMTREERGFGVYENVWEPGGCFNPERCTATWDSITEQMVPVGIVTDPDGFCAWGRPKEE